jgi:hypothetical protein
MFDDNKKDDELRRTDANSSGASQGDADHSDADNGALSGLRIVCIPAADEADELVSMMLAQLLGRLGCEVRHLPVTPRTNLLNELATYAPEIAVISALPPFAVGQARSLCKRLRQRQPNLKLLVGLWNFEGGAAKAQDRVGPNVADRIVTSLQQAVSLLAETKRGFGNEIPSIDARLPDTLPQEIVATNP